MWIGYKKDIVIQLPYLGKSCMYKFYTCVNLKIAFQSNRCIKSFFPYKDRINRSQRSGVIFRANCWDCNAFSLVKLNEGFTIEKPNILRPSQKMTILQPLLTTSKPLDITSKWDHFDILAKGKTDYHCKIKETLFIQEHESVLLVL